MEIIKQMEKSAINFQYVLLLGFVILFPSLRGKAQSIEQIPMLTKSQYEFLTSVFNDKQTKSEKVYYQPRNTNLWVEEFLNSRSENGIGTCLYGNSYLKKAIDELEVSKFETRMFEKNKLPKTIIPIKISKKKKGLHISEPIIIGSYSFLLTWNNRYEAVEIYFKETDSGWTFKCFVILSGKL